MNPDPFSVFSEDQRAAATAAELAPLMAQAQVEMVRAMRGHVIAVTKMRQSLTRTVDLLNGLLLTAFIIGTVYALKGLPW